MTAASPSLVRADSVTATSPSPVVGLIVEAPDDATAIRLTTTVRDALVGAGVSRILPREGLRGTYLASLQPNSAVDPSILLDFVLVVTETHDARGGLEAKLSARSVAPPGIPLELLVSLPQRDEGEWASRLTDAVSKLASGMLVASDRARERGVPPIGVLTVLVTGPNAGVSLAANDLVVAEGPSPLTVGLREGAYAISVSCLAGPHATSSVAVKGESQVTVPCPEPTPVPPPRQHAFPAFPQPPRVPTPSVPEEPVEAQIFAVSAGVGGGRIDKTAVSWFLGGDGPVFYTRRAYWNTGRFRFVMNAEGANQVVLAPLLASVGGLALRTTSGEVQLGLGPAAGLLLLEARPDRQGYVNAAAGATVELGYQTAFDLTQRDRGGLWLGLEGLGLAAPGHDRSVFVGMFAGRFGFLSM